MTSTSPGSRPTRRARRDMTWRRRTRRKSSWASAVGKPVSRGGDKGPLNGTSPDGARTTPRWTTRPRPAVGGVRRRGATCAEPAARCLPSAISSRPQRPRVARRARRSRGGIGIDGSAAPCRWRCAAWVGARREGPEVRRDQLRLEHRHRRGVDGPRLQPGGNARLHRGRARRGTVGPRGADRLVHPDAVHRVRLQLHEPGGPRLRHELRVGHAGAGPQAGWLAGWVIIAADIIVMASLAQIAGIYSFLLVGWQSAADTSWAVTLVGVVWIAIMTWVCVIGIELNAATQRWLLTAEILTLALFAAVALI